MYVKDPDDWDVAAKSYAWRATSQHHSSFALNFSTGELTMKHGTPDGRWAQAGVGMREKIKSLKKVFKEEIKKISKLTHFKVTYSYMQEKVDEVCKSQEKLAKFWHWHL